jgi:hypothetical protein
MASHPKRAGRTLRPELDRDFLQERRISGSEQLASDSWLARLRVREDQVLAVVPTVLLIGMYGAAAFSLLAMGPAWVGFLLGATPVAGLAVWAFTGDDGVGA